MPAVIRPLLLALTLCSGPAFAQTGSLADDSLSPIALSLLIPADRASREISVVVDPGLRRTADLPEELRQPRRDMLADIEIPPDHLRALADRGDGLAALRYYRWLIDGAPAASASDVAYYGALAVRTGRIWPLADAINAMLQLDPATEPADRIQVYIQALYAHAWAGNALALDAVVDLNGEGRLFGPMSDATLARVITAAEAAGDGRIYLRLAIGLLRSAPDDPRVTEFLGHAAQSPNLAVRTTAENLLDRLLGVSETAIASP
jgi:hypothetical protein